MRTAILDRPILPAQFDGLRGITWNRDPLRPIPASEAFALYEACWRFVDRERLSPDERDLIDALTREFGRGVMLD